MRERIGRSEDQVVLPDDVRTVGALADLIKHRGERERNAFGDRRTVRAAVNHRFARDHDAVAGDDEVAFFPPVTGG